ncbi:MAG: NADH-quinone oxidoreductase subunit NuoH [Candidatus Marinimicrobia bacterium]|jgi:NADH-quinone oxidoreductase subunit H|nr:NADH-quinone oxidoreductase subunit NuoH [Candidatus Neomarinimicrobiota bacterium]MDP6592915.1 NADH-quinone oxidoreductase subunit NuoH [Candidatus Neomarinimicrobiota bacterium]MDP6836808.1 NADH-quinone oxidoreductase subunit NuoH [Candidatus Neomarinimicrobiota bacterium]|tara:strand:- start:565 stop:1593 length:1029 start_codon:yes stop_codon:yes gene_type:complete
MDSVTFIIICVKALVVFGAIMLTVMVMTLAERRFSAFMQNRLGPNRVGPKGLLQPVADGIKFLMKEDVIPTGVDKPIFLLAPVMLIVPALMTFAIIPFGSELHLFGRVIQLQVADINIGILYILALTSVGVYGIVLAGWSSNSKYPLLGGLRSSAQLISYELAMGLAIVSIILLAGSLRLNDIITQQQGHFLSWNVFKQPLAFLIFVVAVYAETNRLPFDLTEAEQELVGGYHTEYSSLKFAMFYMAEYANVITASALTVTLFLGGWDIPLLNEAALGNLGVLLSVIAFVIKTALFLFIFIWVRWTFPRFRYDQLMRLGWKVMLPLALVNIFLTAGYLTLTV